MPQRHMAVTLSRAQTIARQTPRADRPIGQEPLRPATHRSDWRPPTAIGRPREQRSTVCLGSANGRAANTPPSRVSVHRAERSTPARAADHRPRRTIVRSHRQKSAGRQWRLPRVRLGWPSGLMAARVGAGSTG